MTLKQQQYTKHNMKTKLSKYEEESLGTNGSKGYGVRVSVSNSSYMAHQDSSEQRDRDREQRMRKSRLASPTSTSSSPVPQGRLKQMSPSEMSGFLGGASEQSNRPYLTSQLINKENTSNNVSTSSPSHFYAAGESQSSASMIESSRDRQADRNNGYNNANSHTHYHNRHASQIDHYRSGEIFLDIFGLPITVSVVKSGFLND
jgi:hypothetical protein